MLKRSLLTLAFCIVTSLTASQSVHAAPDGLLFPVIGATNYSDTFLAYRAGQVDNKHHAIDIFGTKHSRLVSPVDGTIRYVGYPQDSWGWYIVIVDKDGYEYHFMHINNDMPFTDDGMGGAMNAYAYDMLEGNKVAKGQHIAYLGDSGNAENTPAHLHFEIIKPEYTGSPYRDIPLEGFVNPFEYLNRSAHVTSTAVSPTQTTEILPYDQFTGLSSVALAELVSTSTGEEIITGAGQGGGPHVRITNRKSENLGEFFAYDSGFGGGVNVASGDVDGDGANEIVTGAGASGGPHVKVFKKDGMVVGSFFAYDMQFNGGVNVAVGDVDGDGKDEIITGAGPRGGPHVKIFKADGMVIGEFFPYDPAFRGGANVAAGDVDGDGIEEIVTGAGPTGGSHVVVSKYSTTTKKIMPTNSFFAYENFYGGVKVAVGDTNAKTANSEIVTIPQREGQPDVRMFNKDGALIKNNMFIEQWWVGFYDVAATKGESIATAGINRRSTVRGAFAPLRTNLTTP